MPRPAGSSNCRLSRRFTTGAPLGAVRPMPGRSGSYQRALPPSQLGGRLLMGLSLRPRSFRVMARTVS
jgi:hypothetical protein